MIESNIRKREKKVIPGGKNKLLSERKENELFTSVPTMLYVTLYYADTNTIAVEYELAFMPFR